MIIIIEILSKYNLSFTDMINEIMMGVRKPVSTFPGCLSIYQAWNIWITGIMFAANDLSQDP